MCVITKPGHITSSTQAVARIVSSVFTVAAFKTVEKSWGQEDWLVNTELYCAKVLTLNQYCGGSYHGHEFKDETFLCLLGEAILLLGNTPHHANIVNLLPGVFVRIPPKIPHLLIGLSEVPVQILEVSTHHSDDDVVRQWRIDGTANV